MKLWKRLAALGCGVILSLALSGCTIPMPGFADYDVSGYFQAYLDASYHASYSEYIAITAETEDAAQKINAATAENAAVNFCNAYSISPEDSQLQELQVVMRQAFALTKYTVKDEQKVDGGYYIEVEITPISNFAGRSNDIEKLRQAAQNEATATNYTDVSSDESSDEYSDDYSDDYSNDYSDDSSTDSSTGDSPAAGNKTVDANSLFVDKVINFCKQELANISYDSEARTIALDIIQTDGGELQLDTTQLDVIDKTAVRFQG